MLVIIFQLDQKFKGIKLYFNNLRLVLVDKLFGIQIKQFIYFFILLTFEEYLKLTSLFCATQRTKSTVTLFKFFSIFCFTSQRRIYVSLTCNWKHHLQHLPRSNIFGQAPSSRFY